LGKMKEKEYGIKFDGEILCIYLSWHKKVYHTWPKFQCKTVNSETGLWHSLTYGKVFLSSGRVGLFDGLDTLLPRLDRTVMLKYLSPLDSRACSEYINTIPWEVRKEAGAFKNGYKTKRLGRKDTERLLSGKHRKIAAFLGLEDSNAVSRLLLASDTPCRTS